jgi:hypothetical protein
MSGADGRGEKFQIPSTKFQTIAAKEWKRRKTAMVAPHPGFRFSFYFRRLFGAWDLEFGIFHLAAGMKLA